MMLPCRAGGAAGEGSIVCSKGVLSRRRCGYEMLAVAAPLAGLWYVVAILIQGIGIERDTAYYCRSLGQAQIVK